MKEAANCVHGAGNEFKLQCVAGVDGANQIGFAKETVCGGGNPRIFIGAASEFRSRTGVGFKCLVVL